MLVHPHDVDGAGQGVDDATVAVGQAVLHMAQGGVDEDAVLIPGPALHPNVLMKGVVVFQVLARQEHLGAAATSRWIEGFSRLWKAYVDM